jgi:hypothetical protein
LISDNKIDILCLEETEIENNVDHKILSLPGFKCESDINDKKSRVGTYINFKLDFTRRSDLEGSSCHLIILDAKANPRLRIINIHRTFNPLITNRHVSSLKNSHSY